MQIKFKFAPTLTVKDGHQFLNIPDNKFKLIFEPSRVYLNFENLFNGNKALSDNTNLFLNENWQIIFQELKPAIRETFSQILSGIMNSIFQKLPYDEMFNDLATKQ